MKQAKTGTPSKAASAGAGSTRARRLPFLFWGDARIPKELKELIVQNKPTTSLELGCGTGWLSSFMATQGIQATGIDRSPAVIARAKKRFPGDNGNPTFLVGDARQLEVLQEPFDMSFDVRCFHRLNEEGQQKYVSEIYRLLRPGGTHLIWAPDQSPAGTRLSPDYIAVLFEPDFDLAHATFSRRKFIVSHWYRLVRGS